jgi:hypothetical protein
LAVRERRSGKFWEDAKPFSLIVAPEGGYYADPCLVKKDDTNYVFFEEYDLKAGKGAIACAIIDSSGGCSKPETVLERNYHLSYPHVFEWHADMYMVPESVSNRTIELYRAIRFPHQWELIKVLMSDIKAADTTLCFYRGKYWMFTNIASSLDSEPDNLCLFSAESPLGPWRPHRKNPVITDNSRSRPAGALFCVDGDLFRPSQDCSRDYGQAMWLNRVTVLSDDEYEEVPVTRISPGFLQADVRTHTLSQNEDWEVRDGFWWIGKWRKQYGDGVPSQAILPQDQIVGDKMRFGYAANGANSSQVFPHAEPLNDKHRVGEIPGANG